MTHEGADVVECIIYLFSPTVILLFLLKNTLKIKDQQEPSLIVSLPIPSLLLLNNIIFVSSYQVFFFQEKRTPDCTETDNLNK